MDDIRIQIVNYKTKKYLIDCLQSISMDIKNSGLRYSIAILDNNSGDDLSNITSLFPDLNLKITMYDKNIGFGSGHNLLAKNCNVKYLLLLNPDIKIVESDTIKRLVQKAEETKAQVVGPRLITASGTVQKYDHAELYGFFAWISIKINTSYWKEQKQPMEVAWVSGAVFLIENSWFQKLSGFDENFFLYKEEDELCLRLREQGGKVIYDPSITLLHHGGVIAKKSNYMKKSTDYFLDKHYKNHFGYYLYKLINKIIH